MTNKEKEKLEKMIKVAKKVLEENPNDTWVKKGLDLMETELKYINKKIL